MFNSSCFCSSNLKLAKVQKQWRESKAKPATFLDVDTFSNNPTTCLEYNSLLLHYFSCRDHRNTVHNLFCWTGIEMTESLLLTSWSLCFQTYLFLFSFLLFCFHGLFYILVQFNLNVNKFSLIKWHQIVSLKFCPQGVCSFNKPLWIHMLLLSNY